MAEHTFPAGTQIKYSATSGGSYTAIGELVSIQIPPKKRNPSPDTNLNDTDRVIKRTPGMKEPGESKFKTYFTKAQYATLSGFWDSGTEYYWKVETPLLTGESSPSTFGPWAAWVMSIDHDSIEVESEDKIKVEFTMQNNSIPSFTAGS